MAGMTRAHLCAVAQIVALLVLAGLSAMALMRPSESVLNVVGIALIGLQIVALAIAINSQAQGRIFCGVFLAVSLLFTYAVGDQRLAAFFPIERWWRTLALALLDDPVGIGAPLDEWVRIGMLLMAVWLGVLLAAVVHFGVRLRRRKPDSAVEKPAAFAIQVSLRTLLLYMLFCCFVAAWLAHQWRQATAINQAISRLEETCQVKATGYRHPLFPWLSSQVWLDAPQTISSLHVERQCEIPTGLPPVKTVSLARFVSGESTCRMLANLRGVKELSISGTTLSECREQVNLHGVEKLIIRGKMNEPHLDCLDRFPDLRALWLGDIDLSDEGLQHVASHPNLLEVGRRADSLRITNRGAEVLKELVPKGLHSWTIKATVDDDGLANLATCQPGYLYLTNCQLSNVGLQRLGQISRLRLIQFTDTDLSSVALQPLALLPELHTLRLVRCNINDTALRELSAIPNLDALLVEEPGLTDSSLAIVGEFPLLRTATFVGTDISPEAVERFNASSRGALANLARPRESVIGKRRTVDSQTKVSDGISR
jgi:hypothetical protein